jgi:hypothetical protein
MKGEEKVPALFHCKTDFGHTLSLPLQIHDLMKLGAY